MQSQYNNESYAALQENRFYTQMIMTEETVQLLPGEEEDAKPDARPPSLAAQAAPAPDEPPVDQQKSGFAQVAPSTLAHNQSPVYQQQQPPVDQQQPAATMQPMMMMVQGQLPGQMMCPAYTAQSQQTWPSVKLAYVVGDASLHTHSV